MRRKEFFKIILISSDKIDNITITKIHLEIFKIAHFILILHSTSHKSLEITKNLKITVFFQNSNLKAKKNLILYQKNLVLSC